MTRKLNTVNVLLAVVWACIIIVCAANLKDFSVEQVLSFTPESLLSASLIMCALFFLKSLSVFIYSGILFTVNGILFPMWFAIVMDIIGIAIMSTAPFFLGRRLGKRAVDAIKNKYPKFRNLDRSGHENEFLFTTILRLIHFLPSDIVSAFLGANDFSYGKYLLGSVIGVMPSAVMFSFMGTSVSQPGSPQFIFSSAVQIAIILFSFVAAAWLKKRNNKA